MELIKTALIKHAQEKDIKNKSESMIRKGNLMWYEDTNGKSGRKSCNSYQLKQHRLSMTNHNARLALVSIVSLLVIISLAECMKRTQYHEQGVHGPHSYKFGYTSGDHKNPQERHEVSDKKGHVKGWYSYKDPHGKMMVFHYEAHPKKGFKVHKYKKHYHHKKA